MEKKGAKKKIVKQDDQTPPPDLKIKKATDPAFNLETCMNDFKPPEMAEEISDKYFDSYSHFGIHEEMLKDRIRTIAYRNAIIKNPHLFKDKIVLDVGCGTGILSIFAARAGAKHVYGIEFASIANHAKNIIKDNALSDQITIIRGKVEEIELPVKNVDIIISEWMGYFLLYESMLDSVLFARDKWLNPGGMLFPNRAVISVAGLQDEEYKGKILDFWDNVYDVKMSSIKKWSAFEPLVDTVNRSQIITTACPVLDIDLEKVTVADLDFTAKYHIKTKKKDVVSGLVAWFDCYFSHGYEPVKLSTTPFLQSTHWKQTVFYFKESVPVFSENIISGSIAVKKNPKNKRDIDVKLSYHMINQIQRYDNVQCYRIC